MADITSEILSVLKKQLDEQGGGAAGAWLRAWLDSTQSHISAVSQRASEQDVILLFYGNLAHAAGPTTLAREEVLPALVQRALERGSAAELATWVGNLPAIEKRTFFNVLNPQMDPAAGAEETDLAARRFLAAQAIILSLRGVPGIYAHHLLGTTPGRFARAEMEAALKDSRSLPSQIFAGHQTLLHLRQEGAGLSFHPYGAQKVLDFGEGIFAILRHSADDRDFAICAHNVAARPQTITFVPSQIGTRPAGFMKEIVSGLGYAVPRGRSLTLRLEPYQVAWFCPG